MTLENLYANKQFDVNQNELTNTNYEIAPKNLDKTDQTFKDTLNKKLVIKILMNTKFQRELYKISKLNGLN